MAGAANIKNRGNWKNGNKNAMNKKYVNGDMCR